MPKIICFYVTVPNNDSAKKIITHLLDQNLVACGNIISADSLFFWNDKLEFSSEKVCLLKTFKNLKERVQKEIDYLHPYDVPLIAHWSMKVNKPYYDWMMKEINFNNQH
jgi:periplasmic divalent cation tolerance protein